MSDFVRDVRHELDVMRFGQVSADAWLGKHLADEWDCDRTFAYRPQLKLEANDGRMRWGVDYAEGTGSLADAALREDFTKFLGDNVNAWGPGRSPLHVDPIWRNRVVLARTAGGYFSEESPSLIVRTLYRRYGLLDSDHVRLILCDGPIWLGYVATWRTELFTENERATLQDLVLPLHRRLRVERLLGGAPANLDMLVAALEATAAPALVVRRHRAVVEAANSSALSLLGSHTTRNQLGSLIAKALLATAQNRNATSKGGQRPRRPLLADGLEATVIGAAGGIGERVLIVVRQPVTHSTPQLPAIRAAWKLTQRQGEVLQLLVNGLTNKEIAQQLLITEATVEAHITSILRAARVDSRAKLIAKYWSAGSMTRG